MIEQRDVVVVGAGPVGLTLALGLARRGVDVVVLEKEPATAEHSRAPAIWPKAQEIFAELGVLDRLVEEGTTLPRIELWDADRERVLFRIPVEELRGETPWPRLLILPQSKTERLLWEAIRDSTDAEVRFSSEVMGLSQDASGVEIRYRNEGREQRIRARFAAGCDGARSKVREILGGSLEGITYRMQASLADVTLAEDEDLRFPRLTMRPRLAIAIRMGPRLWRLILPFSERHSHAPLDERVDDAVRGLFPRAAYNTVWKSDFRLHRRVSSRWLEGRVVLAGDAAHLNSPVGGEGMNAGIMDAAALREALLKALAKDHEEPLAGYVTRRRRQIEHGVNPFTDRLTRILLLPGKGRAMRPIMRAADMLLRIPPLRRRLLRRLTLLDPS